MTDITKQELVWITPIEYADRYIVSAANRYFKADGSELIIPCVRHYSREHHHIIDLLLESGQIQSKMAYDLNQGFIDQYSNYWTRKEALIIATNANQIGRHRPKTWPEDELFSEDLY
ncbi:hypothetical protein fHeYen901_275 [Yersinia phage fHe-Yen9-01]|uniref:Uncharacterized protein n=1 Tax=Yersinia phage fHe-Yen9-01 TaxID=1965363 RepID=A0A1V0DY39_9CAUD|nr:hypothetical protein KNT60_gp274 [Yersinia phage fHe-Yen9-01]ARB06048.1 hypothetical protein fHeYen901_275 [Yersinia phage fHe-Yen9-01]